MKIDEKNLVYVAPDNITDALYFLQTVVMQLTTWHNTKGKVPLFFLFAMMAKDEGFIELLSKHIKVKNGDTMVGLFDLDSSIVSNFNNLAIHSVGLLVDAILDTDIPDVFLQKIEGFDFTALANELKNVINDLAKLEYSENGDKNILGHLLGTAINGAYKTKYGG